MKCSLGSYAKVKKKKVCVCVCVEREKRGFGLHFVHFCQSITIIKKEVILNLASSEVKFTVSSKKLWHDNLKLN